MPIGANISVIAAGAILAFATHVRTAAVSVTAVGAVLMAVGAAGLALRLAAVMRQRSLTAAEAIQPTEVLVRGTTYDPYYSALDDGSRRI
jgi:hypothetical protein